MLLLSAMRPFFLRREPVFTLGQFQRLSNIFDNAGQIVFGIVVISPLFAKDSVNLLNSCYAKPYCSSVGMYQTVRPEVENFSMRAIALTRRINCVSWVTISDYW